MKYFAITINNWINWLAHLWCFVLAHPTYLHLNLEIFVLLLDQVLGSILLPFAWHLLQVTDLILFLWVFNPFVYQMECSVVVLLLPAQLYHPLSGNCVIPVSWAQDSLQQFSKSGGTGLSFGLRSLLANWSSAALAYFERYSFSLRFWRMKFSWNSRDDRIPIAYIGGCW